MMEIEPILVYNSSLVEIAPGTIFENASQLDEEEVFGMLYANSSRNASTTDSMCTQLSGLDLVNVFTRMDIGNTNFWGSLSVVWVTSFIMYYVLLTILLVCMACSYGYFFKKGLRFFILRLIIILFMLWFCFSCVHNGLLMNSVLNSSSMQLANTARTSEIIASSSFMNFAVLVILSDPSSPRLRCIWPSIIPIYLITGITIVISLLAKGSALIALVVLRLLILMISMILVNLDGINKQCHVTIKERLCLLLKQRKTLIYLYFFLSCGYFSYTLITVLSNGNCIEDIRLHRTIWLVFNCLLRIFEVGFSIIYLIWIRNVFKAPSVVSKDKQNFTIVKRTFMDRMKSCFSRQMDRRSPLKPSGFTYQPSYAQEPPKIAIHHDFSSSAQSSYLIKTDNTVVSNHSCKPDVIKEQKDQVAVIHHPVNGVRSGMIEIEPLFQRLNNYRHYSEKSTDLEATYVESSCFSDSVTCSLSTDVSSNSRASSDESLYINGASSIISDVVIISAQPPVCTEYLIGGTEFKMFDERGGVFHSYNHGVTVIVPPGAVPSGTLAELKFAAMLVAPVKFTSIAPVSAIFWLCMEVVLQKPLQIRLPEMLTKNRSSGLQFAKSLHSPVTVIDQQMNVIEGGKFTAGHNYASIEVDHFCYYCITRDQLDPSDIPQNQYLLIAMKQRYLSPKDINWNVDLCILPRIRTCEKYLKSQYSNDWKLEVLLEFSFDEDGCNELQIKFSSDNSAKVEVLSDKKIEQKDIDFHEYYTNGKLDDLKYRMDRELYPPRRKARVQAKHNSFFESSKTLDYCLTFSKRCITGKIIIPCHNSDSYEVISIESESSLQRNKSLTSGYRSRSDESLESLPDEKEFYSGDLQLRNLILQTKKAEHKWFELGVSLGVPIEKLERIHDKHSDSPIKALIRVYRYWLSDKNGLMPSWKKLVIALQKIDEYGLSTSVSKHMPQDDDSHPAVFSDISSQAMVIKYMQPILLNFATLVPVLNKYNLLTQSDNYILMNINTPPVERANALLYQILPSKGPRAYEMFIKCLQEETEHLGHQELAKKFVLLEKRNKLETIV